MHLYEILLLVAINCLAKGVV